MTSTLRVKNKILDSVKVILHKNPRNIIQCSYPNPFYYIYRYHDAYNRRQIADIVEKLLQSVVLYMREGRYNIILLTVVHDVTNWQAYWPELPCFTYITSVTSRSISTLCDLDGTGKLWKLLSSRLIMEFLIRLMQSLKSDFTPPCLWWYAFHMSTSACL